MIFSNYNMNISYLINEIIYPNINYIIIFSVIFIIVSCIIFIVCSYFILKLLKIRVDNNNILFYKYNKKSKKLLDSYGDFKVTKVYVVREPLSKFMTLLLNIFTLYKFEKTINESRDNFPYHVLLVFEVKLSNNMRKLILIEKNNTIDISENFIINKLQEFKTINLKNKNYTLKSILNNTQTRIGTEKFFNWHPYKNNCQEFAKEILITLDNYSKLKKKYIFRDKVFKIIIPSEFLIHLGNCLFSLSNIFQKYIYDNNLLN